MFGLVLKSTHDKIVKRQCALIDDQNKHIEKQNDLISNLEKRLIRSNADIAGYKKTYNIHTGYWLDTSGRWRDPDTGYCVKASIVMTAKLENERVAKHANAAKAYGDKANAQLQQAGAARSQLTNGDSTTKGGA